MHYTGYNSSNRAALRKIAHGRLMVHSPFREKVSDLRTLIIRTGGNDIIFVQCKTFVQVGWLYLSSADVII